MKEKNKEPLTPRQRFIRSVLYLSAACALMISTSCSQATMSAAAGPPRYQANRENRGLVWKYFHPAYTENWHWTTKFLYWVGPGH